MKKDLLIELGSYVEDFCMEVYVEYMFFYVNLDNFKLLKIVVNVGNGVVGNVLDVIELELVSRNIFIIFIKVYYEVDGIFLNGIFNFLLLENRVDIVDVVKVYSVDFGIVWDGDFDCCFLFDVDG